MFVKIGVLKSFANSTEKHLCWSLFFKKICWLKTCNFIKKTPILVFSCEACEIFKNTFFYRTSPVTGSAPVAASEIFRNLVRRTSYFFFSIHLLMCKKSSSFVCQLSGFLNNSVRVYPVKLKIGMLDHIKNTFRNTVF